MTIRLGSLESSAIGARPELLGPSVGAALHAAGLADAVGVVEIDPVLSDTAATRDAYGIPEAALGNCVLVAGRRDGEERIAACVVAATTRADVNGVVRRMLDVRKASFLPHERAIESTGMEYGGITPVGLPAEWPIFVDAALTARDVVVIGSGVRRSKLLLAGAALASLPGATVVEGLGRSVG